MDYLNFTHYVAKEKVCVLAQDCVSWCRDQHLAMNYEGNFILIFSGIFFFVAYFLMNANHPNLKEELQLKLFKGFFTSGIIMMIAYFVWLLYILKGG